MLYGGLYYGPGSLCRIHVLGGLPEMLTVAIRGPYGLSTALIRDFGA